MRSSAPDALKALRRARLGAAFVVVAVGGLLPFGASAGADNGQVEPTINSATISNGYLPSQSDFHDTCTADVAAGSCDTVLTVVTANVTLPPGASNDCEGPVIAGYAKNTGSDGYFTQSWAGGDFLSNCYVMSGCPSSGSCTLSWTEDPFAYAGGGQRDSVNSAFAIAVSLDFNGNGVSYSKAFPVTIPPPPPAGGGGGGGGGGGCAASAAGAMAAACVTASGQVLEGQVVIEHSNQTTNTYTTKSGRTIRVVIGDTVKTGPKTVFLQKFKDGTTLEVGPNTEVVVTKDRFLQHGGIASYWIKPHDPGPKIVDDGANTQVTPKSKETKFSLSQEGNKVRVRDHEGNEQVVNEQGKPKPVLITPDWETFVFPFGNPRRPKKFIPCKPGPGPIGIDFLCP